MNVVLMLAAAIALTHADVYMHNPRGSNNRHDEDGRERRNANRMFDSQNNNRGGYNVGNLYYYAGSKLMVEWTNQHSCGNPNSNCELVIQYMCGENVRDGTQGGTIPERNRQCLRQNCDTDTRFGMHENNEHYIKCLLRERNMGLFTADQNLNGRTRARNTRQNPNGQRRAYECPEERDYYPYWHDSPWKDIAVLTTNPSRCQYYRAESQNVKERWECVIPENIFITQQYNGQLVIPNNKAACDAWRWPPNNPNGARAVWTRIAPHGVPAPQCVPAAFSRDNHLGNTAGGQHMNFNWTIPDLPSENCALRLRYNISTEDFASWTTNASSNKPLRRGNGANIDLSPQMGLPNRAAAESRGYVLKNNPEVRVFAEVANRFRLRLAINTAQYGRTFQDRSHTFAIRSRDTAALRNAVIHNVNVRGKRGNIVQVYPAVEYDFVPNTVEARRGSFIHLQWTGSDRNPRNNDGQGKAGSDRSNVVLLKRESYPEGTLRAYQGTSKHGHWGRSYPTTLNQTSLLSFTDTDLRQLAFLTSKPYRDENLKELDDAEPYFDLGPRRISNAGIFHYFCTRNNNFSNRSQKGRLIVK